jgi:hypothetical protein
MDIDPRRSLSQQEFCWLEHISKAKFYELKKRGLTPDRSSSFENPKIRPEFQP